MFPSTLRTSTKLSRIRYLIQLVPENKKREICLRLYEANITLLLKQGKGKVRKVIHLRITVKNSKLKKK